MIEGFLPAKINNSQWMIVKILPEVNNLLSILDEYYSREMTVVVEDNHQLIILIRISLVVQQEFVV